VGVAEEFLLGRFAVERGDVTAMELEAVLDERRRATEKPPLFGADLVARGLLMPEQLRRAMSRQTSELVYETLRWTHGFFQLRRANDTAADAGLIELARGAALGIHVDRLLLEGFRRVDEWRVIERVVDNFDRVFVRDETKINALPRGTFTREELAVMELVDGRATVREIVRALRMGSFDVSKVLFRLLRTKLIRGRVEPSLFDGVRPSRSLASTPSRPATTPLASRVSASPLSLRAAGAALHSFPISAESGDEGDARALVGAGL
jgi:hypothetical protein